MTRHTPPSSPSSNVTFDVFFTHATGNGPFPFQRDFAGAPQGRSDWQGADGPPALVDVPTGLGKTAMAVLGWLWRRRYADERVRRATPRRLVYCLPMRVLVEQTRDSAESWLSSLKEAELIDDEVPVHVLMGGEDEPKWEIHPERDAIIIGTQDMLLSRALDRGYAASRARWPMHFGLLNTDCLWVFDEVQLMGSGLATTAQLEAFRRQLTPTNVNGDNGPKDNGCKCVWMSATLRPEWLETVDFKDRIKRTDADTVRIDGKATLSLSAEDHQNDQVAARWNAKKPLTKAESGIDDPAALAAEVRGVHKPGTRTIVVVNTVKRACALFDALSKASSAAKTKGGGDKKETVTAVSAATSATPAAMLSAGPNLVLLHSRFRPKDRAERVAEALAEVDAAGPGTIIVSTQVIEAGVDVSATTLFTELAPWASLVQRFGRCNRRGELNGEASVHWIDLPAQNADAEQVRHPYELPDLRAAADELGKLRDVGPGSLADHRRGLDETKLRALFAHRHTHVIRRKDLLDLFDTTPDLAGNDIDIDRYVREVEETDVRVFWRNYGDLESKSPRPSPNDINGEGRAGGTPRVEPAPRRDELCPAPIGEFRAFAKQHRDRVWRWNFTEKAWVRAETDAIAPGQVFLVHTIAGGYSAERGWSGKTEDIPPLDHAPPQAPPSQADGYEDDHGSQTAVWETIAGHTNVVCDVADQLLSRLEDVGDGMKRAVRLAARWHDWGKAHAVFQDAIKLNGRPNDLSTSREIAKAPENSWRRYARRHFRHELASALGVLQRPHKGLKDLGDDDLNLVAYLIAAHHGKVRLSIRSMPNEQRPSPRELVVGGVQHERRFARGVWDADTLPSVDLGGGGVADEVKLSLEPMELGLGEGEPVECFKGRPSWVERVLRLRDTLGPFRLAYLEALLRAADERASAAASRPAPGATSAEVSHV